MTTQSNPSDLTARITELIESTSEQPTADTVAPDPELDAAKLANALALLRSRGFIVPSLAEAQAISAVNSGESVTDDNPEDSEFVEWRGGGDSATYSADSYADSEREERQRAERRQSAVEQALEMATNVRAMIAGHVCFPPRLADAYTGTLALWILHTYVYQVQGVTPYLLITSPTSGAGKSLALEVMASIARQAEVIVNPTAPVLRSLANSGFTVMIDEVDELAKTRDFSSIANAGYRRGGKSYRFKDGELTRYDVFGPKVFAGIAKEELPIRGATLDRCIQISIERVPQNQAPAYFDAELLASKLAGIRERIEWWAEYAAELLRGADPTTPPLPTVRAIEIWKPLVAIADLLGDPWAPSVRDWATTIEGQKDTAPDANVRLIQDIYAALEDWMQGNPQAKMIPVDELVMLRNTLPTRQLTEQLSPVQFGKRLGRFGIKSQPVKGVRVYKIRDAGGVLLPELADLFARYR